MPRVHVTSEIGPLRAVLVHTPGKELVAVTPENREDYLYDDIIDLDLAQREHRRLVAVLERFAEVHEVRDLLTELVSRADVREFLTTRALAVVPSHALPKPLSPLNPHHLVGPLSEGPPAQPRPLALLSVCTGVAGGRGPGRPRSPGWLGSRALGREGGSGRRDAERAPRAPPRHDLHPARPHGLLRLPAALHRPRAPRGAAPQEECEGRERNAQFLRGAAGGGPAARARVLRRQSAPRARPRTGVGGVPFLRGAPRR